MKIKIALMFSFLFVAPIQAEEDETYSPKAIEIPKSPNIPLKKTVVPVHKPTSSENKVPSPPKEQNSFKKENGEKQAQTYTSAGLVGETTPAPAKKVEAEIKPAPERQKAKMKIRTEDPAGN